MQKFNNHFVKNFDAANWAIILDEMAFVNRELFEILMSTAVAERRALQIETAEEEKYRIIAEKLVLKRIELRQELYFQMNSYESLRKQIHQTETDLTNLQKVIDVYDAEYWQLDDARHYLQSQLFQLQELLRRSQRYCCFNSSSKSSLPLSDSGDKNKNIECESDKCLTMGRKYNAMIPCCDISKKKNYDITNAKGKGQMVTKTMLKINPFVSDVVHEGIKSMKNVVKVATRSKVGEKSGHEPLPSPEKSLQAGSTTKLKQMANEKSISSESDFMWNKKEADSNSNQSVSPSSPLPSNASYFLVKQHKLPFDFKLMEIKEQTECSGPVRPTEIAALSLRHVKPRRSLVDSKQTEKNNEEIKNVTVDEIATDHESTTDLQSSKDIDSSKSSSVSISDGETTDLMSESISFSDMSSKKSDSVSSVNIDINEQEKKVF
ncbi:hypothetical protein LOAG_09707 [Loa loa]|uniref:Uncharacterized protein n=1 Tax=Loa loa TaxID=7209 RepID=A0A1S0TSX0_LOALO|nr:hypothetical protein LOAG_09707 [Loa loa]EFO18786.1 hypothetical protein LOAG_09707 [Loa loa]